MLTYKHPQGKTVIVHDDGSMEVIGKNGKKAATSATPEKLAAGYGGWQLVESAESDVPAMPETKPVRFVLRRPMKFQQADEATLLAAVTDDRWWFQQKVDGVRAQLVIEGDRVWARSGTGGPLKSTVAGPVARKVIDRITPDGGDTLVLDGEILGGQWWMFDMLVHDTTHNPTPYWKRLPRLISYLLEIGDSTPMRLLPTATTTEDKQALVERVIKEGAEGVLLKRTDGTYTSDMRVDHSLKFKVTHTVDCVVIGRNGGDHLNATLAVWDGKDLVAVGSTSMIGKPHAEIGEVLEVRYLYAGAGNRLVQPTVLRKRTDKAATDCTIDQLVFVNKDVLT